jgi:hypothetical protein
LINSPRRNKNISSQVSLNVEKIWLSNLTNGQQS